jgi:3-hydroxybutyryl-CoA dehydrogenase
MTGKSFHKIGIVGSGRMGEDIFYHLNDFEYSLVWVFRKQDLRDRTLEKFNKKMTRMRKAGALDDKAYQYKNEHTLMTVNQEGLNDCDLIIETIIEDAGIKSILFNQLDHVANKDCIFVSNSSSIKPSRICPDSERSDRFAGLHFFFPVRFNKFIEIIKTGHCSLQTLDALKQFTAAIGKTALVLPEEGAFILNKAFIYTQAQAFWALRENILSFREIDALIRKNLFTMGTFEFMDHVGLDVILSSTKNYREDMEHKEFFAIIAEEVQKVVDKGHLGVKTGRGFYSYSKEISEDEPIKLIPISDEERKKYEEELVSKLICLYINLSYDFIDKGYCTESEIEAALSEYKGMEKGPVTLGNQIGFGRVYDWLMHFYNQTGEKVFYPSPSLVKRAGIRKE